MLDITSIIVKMKSFHARKPAQLNEIESAEKKLNLKFNKDYKKCLIEFGQFSIYGHEFTGITKSLRLNVVEITMEERVKKQLIPIDLYVIEQTHIDDIVIWQNEQGEIFQSSFNNSPHKIADSLLDYIKLDL